MASAPELGGARHPFSWWGCPPTRRGLALPRVGLRRSAHPFQGADSSLIWPPCAQTCRSVRRAGLSGGRRRPILPQTLVTLVAAGPLVGPGSSPSREGQTMAVRVSKTGGAVRRAVAAANSLA